MKVKEILKTKRRSGDPLGVPISATVGDALKVMVENDTGSCLVLDGHNLLGMLTFREILARLHKDPANCVTIPVTEIMDPDPDLATPEDTVDQIRNLMTAKHIRYLPVMSAGKLTDVVSFYDVARAVAKSADFENRLLKQYINDWPEDQV